MQNLSEAQADYSVFGPLQTLILQKDITDILVKDYNSIWIDKGGGVEKIPLRLGSSQQLKTLAKRIIAHAGRHIDEAVPFVDAKINNLRVHAVLPPISPSVQLSIRVAKNNINSFDDLGIFNAKEQEFLKQIVYDNKNILITGNASSGKTTLLKCLLNLADKRQRIICVEDVSELNTIHPHVVQLQARQANSDGAGEITLDMLLKQTLRMRPDRIVVGECRGKELSILLSALNTGHKGGMGTLHANSIKDVPARLEALGALNGLTPEALATQAASAFDYIIHLNRYGGKRVFDGIGKLYIDKNRRLASEQINIANLYTQKIYNTNKKIAPKTPLSAANALPARYKHLDFKTIRLNAQNFLKNTKIIPI